MSGIVVMGDELKASSLQLITHHPSLITHRFMNLLGLFRRQIQVARVSGIPVRIDYRWFVVFALSAWVIAFSFREGTTVTQFVRLGWPAAWAAGIATTFAPFPPFFGPGLSPPPLAAAEGTRAERTIPPPF